jgi:hypothetical protein
MCGILFTWWAGRHHNGPIGERSNGGVRGEAVNTRVVKLLPVNKDDQNKVGDSRRADKKGDDGNVKAGEGAPMK